MASIPPQAAASVILTNIPEDGTAPHYIQVASMAQRSGGRQINASDGSSYWVSDTCTVFPYLTRNMLYPQSIFEGAFGVPQSGTHIWQKAIFKHALEGGEEQTADAVWVYYHADGTKAAGWLLDQGKWYYLNPGIGIMERGFIQIDGKTYYLQQDGSMLTEPKMFTLGTDGALT